VQLPAMHEAADSRLYEAPKPSIGMAAFRRAIELRKLAEARQRAAEELTAARDCAGANGTAQVGSVGQPLANGDAHAEEMEVDTAEMERQARVEARQARQQLKTERLDAKKAQVLLVVSDGAAPPIT
jgi:hypothetical protein